MIAAIAGLWMQALVATGQVVDAADRLPVGSASVESSVARTHTRAGGEFAVRARVGDTLLVRRVGYRPARVVFVGDSLRVALTLIAIPLTTVAVQASRSTDARLSASRSVAQARMDGARTTADVVAALPFVVSREGRGGTMLSMRASRAEQVLVLLDGVPLNDPATGWADLSDLPLAALGAITATPGADAARFGSGASGGVVTLTSGDAPTFVADAGSYGEWSVEGAGRGTIGGGTIRVGGSARTARNDFEFLNTAGARDTLERRVNADERWYSAFASGAFPAAQFLALATEGDRGLPGPMNVRIYDAAREHLRRGVLRAVATPGAWSSSLALRALTLGYRDPAHPELASDATALSADADARRAIGHATLALGAGVDRVSGTTLTSHTRPRAFASYAHEATFDALQLSVALRADAISGFPPRLSPSLGLELAPRPSRPSRPSPLSLFARASQSFRAPTFSDLYFASPQQLVARDLRPERVVLDAEVGARVGLEGAAVTASVFDRRTDDAIVWLPGTFTWSPQNVARENASGAEARVVLGGRLVDLDAWAGAYSTRLDIEGQRIPTPYVPRAAAGATLRVHGPRAALSLSLSALGRRPYLEAPATHDTELAGVAVAGVESTYRIPVLGAHALLSAGVRNVGDVRWESVRRYPSAGRVWSAGLAVEP